MESRCFKFFYFQVISESADNDTMMIQALKPVVDMLFAGPGGYVGAPLVEAECYWFEHYAWWRDIAKPDCLPDNITYRQEGIKRYNAVSKVNTEYNL